MDYTQASPTYKIKKAVRYIQLYGIRRTIAKVQAQYHMKRKYDDHNPASEPIAKKGRHVGLLGCGKFGYSNIAYYLKKNYGNVIAACMDIDLDKAISLSEKYKASYYTNDADTIINDPNIDLVYIASNHATHGPYATACLANGKAVHIEKPHATTTNQLVDLVQAMLDYDGKVRLGFNRPQSTLGKMTADALNSQSGPFTLNWFVAGHEIEPDHWYFAPEEGGRILGNLCHWTDLVLQTIPPESRFPLTIYPVRSEKSDSDIVVNYLFPEGSIATISFSAKGHTFEGVRETLNAHRGNVLVNLKDFKSIRIDNVEKVTKKTLLSRDHGHELAVVNSYKLTSQEKQSETPEYVWDTGFLVLKTKEALEAFEPTVVEGYSTSFPAAKAAQY